MKEHVPLRNHHPWRPSFLHVFYVTLLSGLNPERLLTGEKRFLNADNVDTDGSSVATSISTLASGARRRRTFDAELAQRRPRSARYLFVPSSEERDLALPPFHEVQSEDG